MASEQTEVLIVGAGAAGLTLAIDLARRGVDVRLVDKLETPFGGSRGKGLQPRTLEVFEDLGLLAHIQEHARPYPPRRVHRDGQAVDQPMFAPAEPTPAEPYPMPLMLPQNLTEQALRERLRALGGSVRYGAALAGFAQDADGVTATLTTAALATAAGEETIRARYLVGADGGRSFVRQTLGVGFPGETQPFRGLVADLRVEGLSRDAWHVWPGEHGPMVALCPLAGTDLFQLQAGLADDEPPTPDALGAWIHARIGRNDLAFHPPVWSSVFGVNARLAERYRVDRVFLAGDAAHVHPPTGGQGLNTSLQDAYNLGWKLAAVLAGAPDSLLDAYEAERRPIAADVLGLSMGILARASEQMMSRGRDTRQLDLGYRDGPLAVDARRAPGKLLPGDRAPDGLCRARNGRTVRLFELFQGPHWTLLACGAPEPQTLPPDVVAHAIGPDQALAEIDRTIAEAYDITAGTWVLVRPDGYVGLMAEAGDDAALERYFGLAGIQ